MEVNMTFQILYHSFLIGCILYQFYEQYKNRYEVLKMALDFIQHCQLERTKEMFDMGAKVTTLEMLVEQIDKEQRQNNREKYKK